MRCVLMHPPSSPPVTPGDIVKGEEHGHAPEWETVRAECAMGTTSVSGELRQRVMSTAEYEHIVGAGLLVLHMRAKFWAFG